MSSEPAVDQSLVESLLGLPELDQQAGFLREAGLLDADGLERLLDVAEELLDSDPGKTHRLAGLCAELASVAGAPAAIPRADYIRVQTHNENGEFEAALRMAESAYRGYAALGMNLKALRTNIGLMPALLELGRYQEALDAGRVVLDTLDGGGELDVTPTPQEHALLTALVHQNFGACYELTGRYDEALEAYAVAEEHYQTLGMIEHIGDIKTNRGRGLSYLGRGSEALASHEAAAAIFDEAGLALPVAVALVNVGEVHLQLGNYTRGLGAFEQARRMLDSLDARSIKNLSLRHTADAYLALNLHSEALAAYREAEELLRAAGMMHDRAQALWGAGSALITRSEFERAGEALDEAATLFSAADNTPLLSGVMLEQASLQAARGDRRTALATARQALDLVSEDGWPVQQVYARLRLVDLLLPDVEEAETHLMAARRLAERLALPQLRYRLDERLGHLRRLQGFDEEARVLLENAVEEIERLRGAVTQDVMRASFLRDKTAAYENLLRLYLDQDDEDDARRAFTVAERAKSRALVDLLTGVAEKESKASAGPELETRLQTLQADLNAVYNELLGHPDDSERPAPLADLQARAAELEQEISRLRLHVAAAGSTPSCSRPPCRWMSSRTISRPVWRCSPTMSSATRSWRSST